MHFTTMFWVLLKKTVAYRGPELWPFFPVSMARRLKVWRPQLQKQTIKIYENVKHKNFQVYEF